MVSIATAGRLDMLLAGSLPVTAKPGANWRLSSGGSWPAPRCCAYSGFLADNFVASGIRKWPYSDAARLFSDRWVLERYCVMASFEPYVEK